MLKYFKRCGVTNICGQPIDEGNKGYFSASDLKRIKSICEAEGIILSMIPLPLLTSSHVDKEKKAAIVLGQSPEREKDVADIIRTLEACAEVGIPAVKYNLSLLGVMRTGETSGRGGASYSTYRLTERRDPQKLTRAGSVTESEFWDRITWFLSKVVPVAERLKIRMACHPQDPGTPPGGLHGIVNVLGTPDGLKKLVSIHESPWHGVNLCLGTTAEMLANPKSELPSIVEYFAKTGKIFNIHFRNIRGRRDDFQEVFVDEGDVDMPQIARILAKYSYDGMLMPDHVPTHASDPGSLQGFAYAMGYIKGVLQAI
jgi:mannonate dehydratase